MDRERFEELVAEAVEQLPEEFIKKLENVDVVVEDEPTEAQRAKAQGKDLLGLYEGVPLTRRGVNYGMVLPDKITIFQKPIEARTGGKYEIVAEIRKVVRHEIAHYFGIDDERLEEIEQGKESF